MRNMSFSKTIEQARDRSKTVTRRWGWWSLKPGDRVQQVEKAMGLKLGDKVKKIHVIEIIDCHPEPLHCIHANECVLEGFPDRNPSWLQNLLVRMKPSGYTRDEPNRILFKYVDCDKYVDCKERP